MLLPICFNMPAIKKPKILLWNAQGISNKSKQIQLEYFVQRERIDIILLVETFLKQQHAFQLKDFMVYRNDRLNQAHGGVAMAIRKTLQHKFCSPLHTNYIENIAIEIIINNSPTRIIAAYCPKQSTYFENDIQLLTSASNQFMIFGDFNAKHRSWNCSKNNKSGNQLYALQHTSNFLIYNSPEHTHHPHSGQTPSTIDIVLANVNFTFQLSTRAGQLFSDHEPVVCEIDENRQQIASKTFDYKKADWNKFRRLIDLKLRTFQLPESSTDIDNAFNDLTKTILEAQTHSIPIKSVKNRTHISHETKKLIQAKNTLKRQWQRTHTELEKRRLKSEVNRLQKQINVLIDVDVKLYWDKQLRAITKGNKKLWSLAKQYRGKFDSNIDKIKINGAQSFDDLDKANCLAKIFEESHKITANFKHENDTKVRNAVHAFNSFAFLQYETPTITTTEVNLIIKSLKPFKSAGPDTIQNILLKNLSQTTVLWLSNVLNRCIQIGHWPKSFKTAKIIPIFKAGKSPTDPRNYRPISLLNALGKLLEKIVYQKLVDFVEEKQLLPQCQFGFRRGHSTIHQAMRIKQFICNNKSQRKSTGVVLLDIEKAFDSIWHDGLMFKLINMKLPIYLLRLIQSFIHNRQFAVHINSCISSSINIPAGLAQGTCISPILYSLFIADMPTDIKVSTALYADDTALYATAKQSNTIIKALNNSLIMHQLYFNKWKIKINTNKTQAILFPFDNKRKRNPSTDLKNGTHVIELLKSVKYLGVTFDRKLTFGEHISNAIEKTNKCFRAIYPLLAPTSHLSYDNKTLIYKAVIRPILTYGTQIWSSAAYAHLKKFTTMQNKVLKLIFNLHRRTPTSFLEKITRICNINTFIEQANIKFSENCRNSDFNLIREIDLM